MTDSVDRDDFGIRRRLLQMEMLYEVGMAVAESLDPDQVTAEILQRALVLVDARGGALLAMDSQGALRVVGQVGLDGERDRLAGMPEASAAWHEHRLLTPHSEQHHWCLVPLESRQEVAGLLVVADRELRDGGVGPFDEGDQALLRAFALQAGAALHNARLHRSLQEAYAQLELAQRKLAQLEQLRALGDLSAELAHAMRHLLGVIVGRADLFLIQGGEAQPAMEAILKTAVEGEEVLARLQQCTRLGVGRQRGPADLSALAARAVEDVQALWSERLAGLAPDVDWQLALAPVPVTWANEADLQEVMRNLLLNALEAMPDGGRLSVRVAPDGAWLTAIVEDTGTGMDEETRARIFDPFFTTKEGMGTGLGLSIVYRIVEDHGGEVAMTSSPGQGSSFTVRLPVVGQPAGGEGGDGQADPDR
jgi:signal transduction histidine kinase